MKDTLTKAHRNGNGNSAYATELERPEQGYVGMESGGSDETEIEAVENYVPATDFDTVTLNRSQETDPTETDLEEPGNTTGTPTVLREAYFASYDEPLPTEANEVIIGTDDRVRIMNTTLYPWRAICALRMTAADGTRWIGTGWLVGPRTVITAGHCVFMHNNGGWAKSIEVIPGMNGGLRPYGSCVATTFRSVQGWTGSRNREYDYGAIILPANCRMGDRTGYFGYAVRDNNFLMASVLNLSGYPGDKGGSEQWFMSKKAKSVSGRVITYEIDTMGGQSGAPVWVKIGQERYCVGIHTNGHSSGNSATRIVKPVFDNIKAWKALGA